MNNIYFISDIHLGYGTKENDNIRETNLLKFLDHIKKDAGILFILGDLFDFWFEYRNVIPKGYFKTFAKLKELIENKIEIHYLIGNHDCLIRDYFEKEIGIKVYYDEIVKEINSKKFYLHHGDGLSKRDLGYKILKAILRSRIDQWLFSLIHPDFGIWLGKYSSKKSREYTSKKDYGPTDGLYDYARKKIDEGYDYVIMGHIHEMIFEKINNGYYVNLGDWIENYSYAVFDGKNIQLKKFDITNQKYR
jgi:UDP-2,3-diacylglucosamine hydrolase